MDLIERLESSDVGVCYDAAKEIARMAKRISDLEDGLRLAVNRLDVLAWASPVMLAESGIDLKAASRELRAILEKTSQT